MMPISTYKILKRSRSTTSAAPNRTSPTSLTKQSKVVTIGTSLIALGGRVLVMGTVLWIMLALARRAVSAVARVTDSVTTPA